MRIVHDHWQHFHPAIRPAANQPVQAYVANDNHGIAAVRGTDGWKHLQRWPIQHHDNSSLRTPNRHPRRSGQQQPAVGVHSRCLDLLHPYGNATDHCENPAQLSNSPERGATRAHQETRFGLQRGKIAVQSLCHRRVHRRGSFTQVPPHDGGYLLGKLRGHVHENVAHDGPVGPTDFDHISEWHPTPVGVTGELPALPIMRVRFPNHSHFDFPPFTDRW